MLSEPKMREGWSSLDVRSRSARRDIATGLVEHVVLPDGTAVVSAARA